MSALVRNVIVMVALAISVGACASNPKRKPEVVQLTPSQQAIKDSPREREITELAAVLAEAKQDREDEKAVRRADTPEEREARRLLKQAEGRSRKLEGRERRTIERAKISGCDPEEMFIHDDAVSHPTINSFVKIRVTNLSPVPIEISDAKFGTIVKGLCSGGGMTIFRNRSLHSPDYLQFSYVATGRFPDGKIGVAQSETYTLTRYDWRNGMGQQERTWFVSVQPRTW